MTSPTTTGASAPDATVQSANGRFVWYDLLTTNLDAAADFYTKVVKWGTHKWEGSAKPYTMWMAGDAPVGGLMELPEMLAGMPPHWIGYVAVPDVDAAAKQAESLGGSVLTPGTDIPTVGRFAVIADPQGVSIAIFTSAGAPQGHEGAANIGEFSWNELATTDVIGGFEFYSKMFGWELDSDMDMGAMGIYRLFKRNGMQIGGMYTKPPEMPFPPHWLYYAHVDDADAAAERAKAAGGKVLNGPMDVPGGGRIAQCMDPQGGAFAVHSVKG